VVRCSLAFITCCIAQRVRIAFAHAPQDHNQPRCHRILIWVKLCKAGDNNIKYCTVPSLTRGISPRSEPAPRNFKSLRRQGGGPESAAAVD
jgi:hypothetical protein